MDKSCAELRRGGDDEGRMCVRRVANAYCIILSMRRATDAGSKPGYKQVRKSKHARRGEGGLNPLEHEGWRGGGAAGVAEARRRRSSKAGAQSKTAAWECVWHEDSAVGKAWNGGKDSVDAFMVIVTASRNERASKCRNVGRPTMLASR